MVSLSKVPGFRFKTVSAPMAGGGALQVKIRRSLLNPEGKNIAGILSLGGARIYLEVDKAITIGSAKTCDIRINDPRIETSHLMIIGSSEKIEVVNLSGQKISIGNGNLKFLEPYDQNGETLKSGDRIILPLSGISGEGKRKCLELSVQIPEPELISAQNLLVERASVPIEQVAPEQALARVEAQNAEVMVQAAPNAEFKAMVAGTPFAQAEKIEDLAVLYKHYKNKLLEKQVSYGCLGVSVGTAAGCFFEYLFKGALPPGSFVLNLLFNLNIFLLYEGILFNKYSKRICKQLANILLRHEQNEANKVLKELKKRDRELIIICLEEENPIFANDIKKLLDGEKVQIKTALEEPQAQKQLTQAGDEEALVKAEEKEEA